LGIAAMVVGVLSFFVCWLPGVGLAVSALGLLLGLSALALAIIRRGSGVGFAIAGSGLSALSCALCVVWIFAWGNVFKAAADRVSSAQENRAKVVPQAQSEAPVPVPTKAPPAPAKHEPDWAGPDKAVRLGDLQVQIVQTTIGKVPLKTITGDAVSTNVLLMINLELLNTNPTQKAEYHSWTGRGLTFDRDYASLKDNFGNTYKRADFGLGSRPVGAVEGSGSIYPNRSLTEVLVFELPVNAATHLDLELPAKNYGSEGTVRFRIPLESVVRKPDVHAQRDVEGERLRMRQVQEERERQDERARQEAKQEADRLAREAKEKAEGAAKEAAKKKQADFESLVGDYAAANLPAWRRIKDKEWEGPFSATDKKGMQGLVFRVTGTLKVYNMAKEGTVRTVQNMYFFVVKGKVVDSQVTNGAWQTCKFKRTSNAVAGPE
jgi:hypothetical protein